MNIANNKALSIPPTDNPKKENLILEVPDENNFRQVWMVDEMTPGRWELCHAQSTLAICADKHEVKLDQGKWKSGQLYFAKPSYTNED